MEKFVIEVTMTKKLISCLILNFIENFPKEVALDLLERIERTNVLSDEDKKRIKDFKEGVEE